ncbi:MAG: histidine kinase dimerization/phospho-acceptor domain-containing protein, partial [Pseudomonadota bacterium]
MVFGWIKNYLPRGLYGRAALILLLPIVTLQIVVSIVFVQRHFEDVTRQMTATTAVTLNYVLDQAVEAGATAAQDDAGAALGVRITPAATVPDGDGRLWYDLSGVTVLNALPTHLDTRAIDLTVNRRVIAWVAGADGSLWQLDFPRRNVSARNPHQLLVLLIFAGVIMAVVAFIFLRNQLRPIRRLARAAEEFGRGRHRDYTPAGATEVRAAGAAFLDMRARIERQIEQRTLLLSGVSHDLRTPLTRLRLGLSMLPEDDEVRALRRDVDDMAGMLDAFLEFAREDAAEAAVKQDLVALLRDCVDDAHRGHLPVTFSQTPQAAEVPVRGAAVKRAVMNLITNGARHGD